MCKISSDKISLNILNFIYDNFPSARQKNASQKDNLLECRIIDSMGLLDVIIFLEDTYGITINNEDVIGENFGTVQNISEYVQRTLENKVNNFIE